MEKKTKMIAANKTSAAARPQTPQSNPFAFCFISLRDILFPLSFNILPHGVPKHRIHKDV